MINVTAGSTTSGVTQALAAQATIAGTVANPAKAAVVGAEVKAFSGVTSETCGPIIAADGAEVLSSATVQLGTLITQATTNASGEYAITLAPGSYTVCVVPAAGVNLLASQAVVTAGGGAHNVTLATGGQITGTVAAKVGGAAVNGAVVKAYGEAGAGVVFAAPYRTSDVAGLAAATTTNNAGEYSIVGLASGEYALVIEAAGFEDAVR